MPGHGLVLGTMPGHGCFVGSIQANLFDWVQAQYAHQEAK